MKDYPIYDLRRILGEDFDGVYDNIIIRRMKINMGEAEVVLISADRLIMFIERYENLDLNIKSIYDKVDKFLVEKSLDALATYFSISKIEEGDEDDPGYCDKCGNYSWQVIRGEGDKMYCSQECFKLGDGHVN